MQQPIAGRADEYVELVCNEMLAAAVGAGARWIDAFCETGAFDADQCRAVLDAGRAAGLGLRLHAAVHVEIGTGANKRRLPPVKLGGNGGYAATNVATALQAEGGDAVSWLAGQIEGRYPEFETEQWTVISVDVDVW